MCERCGIEPCGCKPRFGRRLRKKLDEAAEFARRPFKTRRQDFSEDLELKEEAVVPEDPDTRARAVVVAYSRGAAVAMFAIPVPGAGTLTAYALDALMAAFGAKRITAGIGLAAAGYYKSGKKLAPADLKAHVANFFRGTEEFLTVLSGIPSGRVLSISLAPASASKDF